MKIPEINFHKRDLLLAPVAMLAVYFGIVELVMDRRPPITIHDVTVIGPVKAGEEFVLSVHRTKVRDCASEFNLFLIDEMGNQHTVGMKPGSAVGIGNATIRVALEAPSNLSPGNYTFRSHGTYFCEDGKHFIRQPDAFVRVVP